MQKLVVVCTCDDNCDSSCPAHSSEYEVTELQAQLREAKEVLSEDGAIGQIVLTCIGLGTMLKNQELYEAAMAAEQARRKLLCAAAPENSDE